MTLSAGDSATVGAAGKAVFIGKEAGSDHNRLEIAGILVANTVRIGAETGNAGNTLVLRSTADIRNTRELVLGAESVLSVEGDFTADGALAAYLGETVLRVWDGAGLRTVTGENQARLLAGEFSGGFTNFTVVRGLPLAEADETEPEARGPGR